MDMKDPGYDETDMTAEEFEARIARAAAARTGGGGVVVPPSSNISNAASASPSGGAVQVNLSYRPTSPVYRLAMPEASAPVAAR